jgi:hypothetical protein
MKILIIMVMLGVIGCSSHKISEPEGKFRVLTYDGCQYVYRSVGHKGYLAHKGNCYFCEKRRNK